MESPRRKRNRLPVDRYAGKQFYFLTICTHGRKGLFKDERLVEVLQGILNRTCEEQGFIVYAFCFMPDHLHMEVVGNQDSASLQKLIRSFKGRATAQARRLGFRALWQKGFYDHIVRKRDGPDSVAHYIFQNPVRKGLVQTWVEWPFSGSAVFKWKQLPPSPKTFMPPWKT